MAEDDNVEEEAQRMAGFREYWAVPRARYLLAAVVTVVLALPASASGASGRAEIAFVSDDSIGRCAPIGVSAGC